MNKLLKLILLSIIVLGQLQAVVISKKTDKTILIERAMVEITKKHNIKINEIKNLIKKEQMNNMVDEELLLSYNEELEYERTRLLGNKTEISIYIKKFKKEDRFDRNISNIVNESKEEPKIIEVVKIKPIKIEKQTVKKENVEEKSVKRDFNKEGYMDITEFLKQ
jgi:hypothetical protein